MNEEMKSAIEAGLAEVKSKVDSAIAEKAGEVKSISEQVNEIKSQLDAAKDGSVTKEYAEKMQEQLDALDVKMQKGGMRGTEEKSFNDNLSEIIQEKADQLKAFASSTDKEMKLEMKAVGDMSSANFAGQSYNNLTTDYRQGVLPLADNTIYMRDLLPKGTTQAGSITYPRHTGGEGAPATWNTGTKPLVDFDFDAVTTPVQWI